MLTAKEQHAELMAAPPSVHLKLEARKATEGSVPRIDDQQSILCRSALQVNHWPYVYLFHGNKVKGPDCGFRVPGSRMEALVTILTEGMPCCVSRGHSQIELPRFRPRIELATSPDGGIMPSLFREAQPDPTKPLGICALPENGWGLNLGVTQVEEHYTLRWALIPRIIPPFTKKGSLDLEKSATIIDKFFREYFEAAPIWDNALWN